MSAVMSLRDGMMRDWHDWFEVRSNPHRHWLSDTDQG